MTLIGVLAHDRPDALRTCLESVHLAGAPARVVVHVDAPEPGVLEVVEDSGFEYVLTEDTRGIGAALNTLQKRFREPGEDFFRLDGDTAVVTPDWLTLLQEEYRTGVGIVQPTRWSEFRGLWWPREGPGVTKLAETYDDTTYGSAALIRGEVLDRVGYWRSRPYGYDIEDWDMWFRAELLGYRLLFSGNVTVHDVGEPVRKVWSSQSPRKSRVQRAAIRSSKYEMRREHRAMHVTREVWRDA